MNQMLLCFGVIFAAQVVECSNGLVFAYFLLYLNVVDVTWIYISQDSSGMLALLGIIEQCLKAGKKQSWHAASVTNICVGLLTGFKVLFFLLWSTQRIFCGPYLIIKISCSCSGFAFITSPTTRTRNNKFSTVYFSGINYVSDQDDDSDNCYCCIWHCWDHCIVVMLFFIL